MKRKLIFALVGLALAMTGANAAEDTVKDTLGTVKSVAASPAGLIKGQISGVRVSSIDGASNGLQNVNIRGLNTLRGDSQPLWIVDGAIIGSNINQNLNAFYLAGGKTINGDKLPDYSGQSYTYPIGNFGWLNPYDIESIEVVKDLSATSRYGMLGANGVVIINTRKPTSGDYNIWVNSNVGMDMSTQSGDAFKNGILTSHDVGVNGVFGTNSFYNISGFMRHSAGAVQNNGATYGGLTINMETVANDIFHFGLNSFLNFGDYVNTAGTNFIGAPSTMVLSRYPDAFKGDKLEAWLKSYDDETIDYRTVNSVWLRVNFLKTLHLKLTGGADYQNQTRYLWFGNATSFGKKENGATSILNNSLLNYNFSGELNFDRSFAVRHHLVASVSYDLSGNLNRTNAMCGSDFDLPYLRGKGLSSSGSLHAISKFARTYSRMGGYALLSYDFDAIAGISATARWDQTMRFDKEPMWMPAGNVFVDLKRAFFRNSSAVSALKLTGGYGCAGHETVLPYEYMHAWISNVPEVEAGTEPYFDGFNRLLSEEWNIGFNLGFLNDRINFAFKYYDKSTEDSFRIYNFGKVLSNMWVATENWQLHQERMSSLKNSGFELDADFRIIQTSKVSWNAGVNVAHNINSVLSLDSQDKVAMDIVKGCYLSSNEEGKSVGQVLGMNTLPKLHGGLSTALSLYGVTLDARISGASGFSIINANRIIERGPEDMAVTEADIEKGDYLRLDCVGVSYDIPLHVKWMKALKVNLAAHNLLTLTDYSGWNPDVNSFGVNTRAYGVDYGSFPICRSVVLGVTLRF